MYPSWVLWVSLGVVMCVMGVMGFVMGVLYLCTPCPRGPSSGEMVRRHIERYSAAQGAVHSLPPAAVLLGGGGAWNTVVSLVAGSGARGTGGSFQSKPAGEGQGKGRGR